MMLTNVKYWMGFTLIGVFLLIAAQCGAVPPVGETPSPAEVAEQTGEAEQRDTHNHQAEEQEPPALTPVDLAQGEKLQVVATTSIVADIVRQVGGDLIDLSLLLPIGTDPHTFEPTPRDLAAVADADVIFANGLGLEAFLEEIIKNAGGEAATIYLSRGVEVRQLETADEHEHEGIDPHTWTSPANAVTFVHNIEQALSRLDPAQADRYSAQAETYEAQLETLDAWVHSQIETIPAENRELVTDHAVFGYYADRYGLEQIGAVIPSFSTAAEPSAKELAELEDAISEYDVKAIFVGASVNPALSERVARDTGTQVLTLYTGSLGEAGSGIESYLEYIEYNTNTIVTGLR